MISNKILCVAVHPDDETLGAGGALLKWKSEGKEIHWLILTAMDRSISETERIDSRSLEIDRVNKEYGFTSMTKLDFITTQLDQYAMADLVKKISTVISKIQPDTLIIPHKYDAHSDHRMAFEALMPFMKSFRYPYIKTILSMETLSETNYANYGNHEQFFPSYFVDVSDFLESKINIMKIYESELGKHPFPRSEVSLVAQAQLRGAIISAKYAEAFQVIKIVN